MNGSNSISPLKSLIFIAVAGVAVLRGCDCVSGGDKLRETKWSCEDNGRPELTTNPCGAGRRFVKGECMGARCDGDLDPNCCPGLFCDGGGTCQPKGAVASLACENDDACFVPGQRCLDRPRVSATNKTCGYVPPDVNGLCPDGLQLFNKRCVSSKELPCGGPCPSGQVCNIDMNACETVPTLPNADSGCDQACGDAQMLVYSDPDTMLFDQCCVITCTCEMLPNLAPGPFGRYSDLEVRDDGIWVSGYDSAYGDLVLAKYPLASTNVPESLTYIDGVPSGTPVVANPQGIRGGQDAPGPNVGTYTSLAFVGAEPRIAYYDVDDQDLKLARFDGASWHISLIDGGRDGDYDDVGRYTSLQVDESGRAHVTYYAHRLEQDGGFVSALMYARSTTPSPSGIEDWERVTIDSVGSCDGTCSDSQVCVLDAGVPTCKAPSTDCATACACDQACVESSGPTCLTALPNALLVPCNGSCGDAEVCVDDLAGGTTCLAEAQGCGGCGTGQVCVNDGTAATCRVETPYPSVTGLPVGLGLFSSLAFSANAPVVAFYDSSRGHLRGAVANFEVDEDVSQGFAAFPIACAAGEDIGQFASLAVHEGGVAVAYQGSSGETLWMCSGADLLSCGSNTMLIDDGERATGGIHFVGAYASLVFDPTSGRFFVAYADQTTSELLLAYGIDVDWSRATLLHNGAYGSFTKLQRAAASDAYISNYERSFDARDNDTSRIVIEAIDFTDFD